MTISQAMADGPEKAQLSVVLTGFAVALTVVFLAAGAVDPRLLDGVPVWSKPLKFAVSSVVLFGTIAWLETRLSEAWRSGWILSTTLAVMGIAMAAEIGYIAFQAAQAEPSHFNLSTPFHAFMYSVVMFSGALALVIGIGIYGMAAALDRCAPLTPGLRLGVVTGFGLSFILTLIVAGYIGGQSGHFAGTPDPDAAVIPFFGWSTSGGDLRPAHFLALHAMQALPVLGWVLDRSAAGVARTGVAAGSVAYTVATLGLFALALAT